MSEQVLVTGGSGFIGVHCIAALLRAGYPVRTTVRSTSQSDDVLAMLRRDGVDAGGRLDFAAADLTRDEGWAQAAAGCGFVLHVASPFHIGGGFTDADYIAPAVDGTVRVLRAARDAGAKRVVVTSSFAAVGYGHTDDRLLTEEDWTNVSGADVSPYIKSKTLAERAAWDFMAREGGGMELATVNPVGVFGPALGPKLSGSVEILQRMLKGEMPALPRITFGAVDVRDVADLHLLAMTRAEAAGERFLAISGEPIPFVDYAKILREHLGPRARKVPTVQLPDWLVKSFVLIRPDMKEVVPQLGKRRLTNSAKAMRVLGWRPRPVAEALNASADSLIALGLV